MCALFRPRPFNDPQLGELRRSRGLWRGEILLGDAPVPLMLSGTRATPDPTALTMARDVTPSFESWRKHIERALFEHYSPYAEAVAAGEDEPPEMGLPVIAEPSAVWSHATAEFVLIAPLSGQLAVEIAYRVAWDEEHTVAARLRDGQLIELCGSVLAP